MLTACGPGRHAAAPVGPGPGTGSSEEELGLAGSDAEHPAATREETLAAIQKAMTDLDPVAHQCWAAAAVDRFDIAGSLTLRIAVGHTDASVSTVSDTVRDAKLGACMVAVLEHYPWAPPLWDQTIQLPFRFTAPDGQNTIDRRLVSPVVQGKLAVAVLLDQTNSGNAAASMVELAIAAGGHTGARIAERAELWYFLADAIVDGKPVAAGDMIFVPAGGVRDVAAGAADTHAMIVMTPGGREGVKARGGALPTREAADGDRGRAAPIARAAAAAKHDGPATIYAEPATIHADALAASLLALPAGATVAEHVHAKETELLYMLDCAGTMTVNGVALAITPTTVVQIPAGAKHAFTATTACRAPSRSTRRPAPEQRFKARACRSERTSTRSSAGDAQSAPPRG